MTGVKRGHDCRYGETYTFIPGGNGLENDSLRVQEAFIGTERAEHKRMTAFLDLSHADGRH